ncbi:hypothetical protein CDQ92_08255 [Sphingopyxis bauzanensis]|uniref:Uncharacterized protein n=1 Tax=Sphingopyxis bauzanensis TaxID=651663 RepID=A0A246JVG7_9SPHN|nr:hypothetical protein CDQ92_08255 [Sphingopyxis bauzanensis]
MLGQERQSSEIYRQSNGAQAGRFASVLPGLAAIDRLPRKSGGHAGLNAQGRCDRRSATIIRDWLAIRPNRQ